jgi:hypothetical protein
MLLGAVHLCVASGIYDRDYGIRFKDIMTVWIFWTLKGHRRGGNAIQYCGFRRLAYSTWIHIYKCFNSSFMSTQHLSLSKWLTRDLLRLANLGFMARGLKWVS